MYYFNSFLLYSIIGFILESTIYKINHVNRHSGFLYGPITMVYGIGVIAILVVDKYILKYIKTNKILKIIISYLILMFTLTLVEFICGNITHYLFNIDMWDYSNQPFHYGKYICLNLALIWGLFGLLFIYVIKPFMDRFIKRIPKKVTYLFIFIFVIDIFISAILK